MTINPLSMNTDNRSLGVFTRLRFWHVCKANKRFLRFALAALTLGMFAGAAASTEEPVRIDLTVAQWQEDIRFFGQEMARMHRSAFHLTSRPAFERAVEDLIARTPALENYQVVQGLSALTASIGDGHTFLAASSTYHHYPIGLFQFGEELRVIRASAQYRKLLGARIISVEGRPIAEVQRALQRYIPQGENQWYLLEHCGEVLVTPESIAALGITPRLGPVRILLESADGRRFALRLPALAPGTKIAWTQADQISPSLRWRDGSLWFTHLPEAKTVYADFRSYGQLEQNAKALWAFIDANDVDRLVIDLRHNAGGNYSEGRRHLLYPAIFHPRLNRAGHLYVLTGRTTFSGARPRRSWLESPRARGPTGSRRMAGSICRTPTSAFPRRNCAIVSAMKARMRFILITASIRILRHIGPGEIP